MTFLIELIHILAAALLAVLGIGYERDRDDCPPIRFEPAAHVSVQAESAPHLVTLAYDDASSGVIWSEVNRDCEQTRPHLTLPVL
ncbi:MAG: hypothetical protein GC187_00150 [Alphaproteobacteria bacterium]|nr:hypothetical protein [Alphaproteobacteria bacterium]